MDISYITYDITHIIFDIDLWSIESWLHPYKAGTVNPSKLLNQLETKIENIKYNLQIIELKISDDSVTIYGPEVAIKAKKILLALGVGCNDFAEKHLGRKVNGLRAVRGTMWSTKDTQSLPRLK